MSWSDIQILHIKPIEEKKKEIDWLEEVNKIKRECRIKTKTAEVIYPYYYKRRHRYKNYTETLCE